MVHSQKKIPTLVLASTSAYRTELLKNAGFIFQNKMPQIDEHDLKQQLLNEKKTAIEIAELLSKAKAQSVFKAGTVVIGADQLIRFNNEIIGKPNTTDIAIKQLLKMNNQSHELITAVSVMTDQQTFHLNHVTYLQLKNLTKTEIENYIQLDQPLDCAGSYKIEKGGICLFSKIQTDDFTAIQGLPMIWLSTQLKGLGYEYFKN